MKASERERSALRDATKRAVLEKADKARRAALKLAEPPRADDLLLLAGWRREALTRTEALAADQDDAELSRLVAAEVNANVALGNLLARRRRAHEGAS